MWIVVALMVVASGIFAWSAWRSPDRRRERAVSAATTFLGVAVAILAVQILHANQALAIALALLIAIPGVIYDLGKPAGP